MGRNPRYICQKPQPKTEQPVVPARNISTEPASSDDEDDEDELGASHSGLVNKESDAGGGQDGTAYVVGVDRMEQRMQ